MSWERRFDINCNYLKFLNISLQPWKTETQETLNMNLNDHNLQKRIYRPWPSSCHNFVHFPIFTFVLPTRTPRLQVYTRLYRISVFGSIITTVGDVTDDFTCSQFVLLVLVASSAAVTEFVVPMISALARSLCVLEAHPKIWCSASELLQH